MNRNNLFLGSLGVAALLLPIRAFAAPCIKPPTQHTYEFKDCLQENGVARVKDKGKWGLLDRNGNVVAAPTFDDICGFAKIGLACAIKNGKSGFINQKGETVIPFVYDDAHSFNEGLAAVAKNDRYGFIDQYGKTVIPLQYENAGLFALGLANVKRKGKYGFINRQGKTVLPFIYDDADSFERDIALTRVEIKGKPSVINTKGQTIVPPGKYDEIPYFYRGMAAARKNGYWGFINGHGDVLIPFIYDDVQYYSDDENRIMVKYQGKYGMIDRENNIIIPFEYDSLFNFQEGLAVAFRGEKAGFIDANNQVVIPFVYEYAESFDEGKAFVQQNGRWFGIDRQGRRTD
ncbi:WG repeat-containing protein [Conchiformibius kuhniae]|uniref:WG repeat-containing protein n=1 Tax=Conchiformibius kuhniae TaxID=211502 RepID=A0A8T9MV57_9NEIS|nr:WG repeat-containing protein [Conchiformibius kuhniae]UOP04994.1 WG repeat-containing protein [Conchiformibius kuhniae]